MKIDEETELRRRTEAEAKRAEDFDDLQNEQAGRETGKMARFLTGADAPTKTNEKARKEREAFQTRLQIMLCDPAYRALFEQTSRVLRDAQARLDAAQECVMELRAGIDAEFDDMLRRAAHTPDGRPVFQDQNGDFRALDGKKIDDELAATIVLRGDEPSFADALALQEQRERVDRLSADIAAGQVEVGDAQERLENPDDPPSAEDLEAMQANADALLAGIDAELDSLSLNNPEDLSHSSGPALQASLDALKL